MPSLPVKLWVAAGTGVTALLLVILVAQNSGRRSTAAPTQSTAGGTAAGRSPSNATADSSDAAKLDQAASHAYCNVTGPCESCPPPTGGDVSSAKLLSCEESGYRKPLTCVLGKSEDAPLHEVMLEAFHASKQQAGERFDSYAPCGAENGAGLSVAAFEWLILAMLCVSVPVMLWRKWGLRTLLPL